MATQYLKLTLQLGGRVNSMGVSQIAFAEVALIGRALCTASGTGYALFSLNSVVMTTAHYTQAQCLLSRVCRKHQPIGNGQSTVYKVCPGRSQYIVLSCHRGEQFFLVGSNREETDPLLWL